MYLWSQPLGRVPGKIPPVEPSLPVESCPGSPRWRASKIPPLLEGLVQARVSGLQVSVRHSHNGRFPIFPFLYLLSRLRRLWPWVPNVIPNVSSAHHYCQTPPLEKSLGPGDISCRNDKATLGWIQEVHPWVSLSHYVVQVGLCYGNVSTRFYGVCVPLLHNLWVLFLDFTDE